MGQVFALDGRGRVTSRIYPMGTDNRWGVSAFGTFGTTPATANATVWEMDSAFDPEQAQACC